MRRQSTKLVVNTGAMIFRTLGQVVFALVTTRLVIDTMGSIDYGLFLVVGVSVGLTGIINDALVHSGSRHMGVRLGADDQAGVTRVFNSLLALGVGFAFLAVGIGIAAAIPVSGVLDVPDERFNSTQGWEADADQGVPGRAE